MPCQNDLTSTARSNSQALLILPRRLLPPCLPCCWMLCERDQRGTLSRWDMLWAPSSLLMPIKAVPSDSCTSSGLILAPPQSWHFCEAGDMQCSRLFLELPVELAVTAQKGSACHQCHLTVSRMSKSHLCNVFSLPGELGCVIWLCAQLVLTGSLSKAFTALLYLIPNGLLRGLKAEACLSPEADSHHVSTFSPQTVSYVALYFVHTAWQLLWVMTGAVCSSKEIDVKFYLRGWAIERMGLFSGSAPCRIFIHLIGCFMQFHFSRLSGIWSSSPPGPEMHRYSVIEWSVRRTKPGPALSPALALSSLGCARNSHVHFLHLSFGPELFE